MKRLIVFLMFLSVPALAQQVSRYDNIAIGLLQGGNILQALPQATITVTSCTSGSQSCTTPASLCQNITDTTCGLTNIITADSGGNFHFYAHAGRYMIVVTKSGFAGHTIPDVILPVSASDPGGGGGGGSGGTQLTINGTQAIPNAIDFNSNLLVPSGNTPVQWVLNGNQATGYVPTGNAGGGGSVSVNGSSITNPNFINSSNLTWSVNGSDISGTVIGTGGGTGGGGGGGPVGPIAPGTQACVAENSASTHTVSLSISVGNTVLVGIGAYDGYLNSTFTVVDSNGTSYGNPLVTTSTSAGTLAASFVWAAVNVGQAATSITVTRTTGSSKFVTCARTYTGIGSIGAGTTNNSGTAGGSLHTNLNGLAQGHYIFTIFNAAAATSTSFSAGSPAAGTFVANAATSAGNTASSMICENTTASNGVAACNATIPAGIAWSASAVELIPGTGSGGGSGGGGGGVTLPITPVYDLFASTGAGGAAASGVKGTNGWFRTGVVTANASQTGSDPFGGSNGSVEWFPTGAYNVTAPNGAVFLFGHGSGATSATNGVVALAGGNTAGGATNQVYLACGPTGCDFKGGPGTAFPNVNPPTFNGNPIGGGGGGGSGTVNPGTVNQFAYYTGSTTVSANGHLDDGLTTAATITSTEPMATPRLNLVGAGGAALTSTGGQLPPVAAGQGGFGIGANGMPYLEVSGGAWQAAVTSVFGRTGAVTAQAGDYAGLYAPLASPAFTGTPTAPTVLNTDNSTSIATTAWVKSQGYGTGGGGGGGGAIVLEQHPACGGDSSQGAGTVTVNTPITVNANDTVLVTVHMYTSTNTVIAVTDPAGNQYTQVATSLGAGGYGGVQIWSGPIGSSLATTQVSAARSGTNTKFLVCAATFSGVASINTAATNSATATTNPMTVSLASAAVGHVAFMAGSTGGANIVSFGNPTAGTQVASAVTTATAAASAFTCYNTAATVGALGCSTTLTPVANWGAAVVELVPGSGASGMTWPAAAGIAVYSGSTTTGWSPSYNSSNPIPVTFLPTTLTQNTSGNAGTATQLATTPTLCGSGQFAQGVLANGNATGCAAAGGGTTTNSLTFATSGGAAAGATFNGSSALTVSPATIGAAALANPVFTGTVNTPSIQDTGSAVNINQLLTTTAPINANAGINLNATSQLNGAEGTAPSAIGSTTDQLWADSSNRRWRMITNNGAANASITSNLVGDAMANTFTGLNTFNGVSVFNTQVQFGQNTFRNGEASIIAPTTALGGAETNIFRSATTMPANRLRANTVIRVTWIGTCTSTVANTSTFTVRYGAGVAGNTTDPIVVSATTTTPAATSGTNVPFKAVMEITITAAGAAGTAAAVGTLTLMNNGTTGISTTPVQVITATPGTTFTTVTGNQYLSISYASAATTTTATFSQAFIEMVYQ